MTDEMIALGRRAVACKGWRWLPGVLSCYYCDENGDNRVCRSRIVSIQDGRVQASHSSASFPLDRLDDEFPDLTDPATLGCLLALVREAWDDPHCHTEPPGNKWALYYNEPKAPSPQWLAVFGDTEAEALVAALEAAP